jgi:hypothetical protein
MLPRIQYIQIRNEFFIILKFIEAAFFKIEIYFIFRNIYLYIGGEAWGKETIGETQT